jgi:TetR/AcrR family transcriptional regulator, ethionamide resistance regulator
VPVLSRGDGERRDAPAAALLDATERLLAEDGSYADLSVERISAEAGLSRTAFYKHFSDKRDLLLRLSERALEPVMANADELAGGVPSGPGAIRGTLELAAEGHRRHAALLSAVIEAATYDEAVAEVWRALVDRVAGAIAARIEGQQKRGEAPPIAARPAATALVLMTAHTLNELGPADEELLDTLELLCVRAIYGIERPPR